MATLVRTKSESKVGSRNPFLSSTIPAPFPREQLQPTRGTEETISVPSEHDVHAEAGPSHLQTASTDIHTTEIILVSLFLVKWIQFSPATATRTGSLHRLCRTDLYHDPQQPPFHTNTVGSNSTGPPTFNAGVAQYHVQTSAHLLIICPSHSRQQFA